jgi:anti-sigma factor RsiW
MNHEPYQQQISQLVDDELDESQERDLFVHLGSCTECRTFLKSAWQMQIDIQSRKPRGQVSSMTAEGVSRSRWQGNKPSIAFSPPLKQTRFSIRTFALALLVVVLGCVMLSSKVMVNEGAYTGSHAVQNNFANGVQ